MIVRGEGSHVYDDDGNRYIDGLSGLYCLNLGHSHGEELGAKAAAQMADAPVHVQLDGRSSAGDRAGRRSSPSWRRTASSARSSPPAERRRSSRPTRWPSSITRPTASRSAARRSLAATPTTAFRSEPSRSPASRSAARPSSRCRCRPRTSPRPTPIAIPRATTRRRSPRALLDEIEQTIEFERPETIAMIIMEPVQNAGGSIVPPDGLLAGPPRDLRQARDPPRLRRGRSAPSAGSGPGSARSASTTRRTSSPSPRASPAPTPRWAE